MEFSAATSHCTARAGVLGQQRLAPFADMQHDGPGFEKYKPVLLEDRHLTERLKRAIVRLVLIPHFEKTRRVRQTGFLQRPARAQIAHLALGKLRNPFESGDRDHAMCSFAILVASGGRYSAHEH